MIIRRFIKKTFIQRWWPSNDQSHCSVVEGVPNSKKLYEYLFSILGSWHISPRKSLILIADIALLYPLGDNVASITFSMDKATFSWTSSKQSPYGQRRNSGFDHALHSLESKGYWALPFSVAVRFSRRQLVAWTMDSISSSSSSAVNKLGMISPSVVTPRNGSR